VDAGAISKVGDVTVGVAPTTMSSVPAVVSPVKVNRYT
jgi:hypothetical protein